jgi:hypothetical protein
LLAVGARMSGDGKRPDAICAPDGIHRGVGHAPMAEEIPFFARSEHEGIVGKFHTVGSSFAFIMSGTVQFPDIEGATRALLGAASHTLKSIAIKAADQRVV